MNIGKAIKTLRSNSYLSQKELSERLGITQSYLSLLESNKKTPSVDTLQDVSTFFNIPLPILFWFTVDVSDVEESKAHIYKTLKAPIDSMIKSLFELPNK